MEKMDITAKTKLGEVITLLDLKSGQKKKGKTPTRLKLTTSEEPLVQVYGSTLYAIGYASMKMVCADTLLSGFRTA